MQKVTENPEILLQNSLVSPSERIAFFRYNGMGYWVKRPERLGRLRRLQKGNAEKSFRREVSLLKQFWDRGAPVVQIAAEAPDRVILPDMGLTLAALASRVPAPEMQTLLKETAVALAQLHGAGLAHGRPRLRDICWTGTEICFLDLEAGAQVNASRWRQSLDVLLLVHSVFQSSHAIGHHVPAVLDAYGSADRGQVLQMARKLARALSPLRILAAPFAARDRRRGKTNSEVVALIAVLDHFR